MKPHRVIKEHKPPFRAFWNDNEVTVTSAIMTWNGKQRSQIVFRDGSTKLVATSRLKFSIKDLFKDD